MTRHYPITGNPSGKYAGIVLYSDLDGTLLDENRCLSRENLEAVQLFIREGGRFAIATGRMEQTTRVNFPELPVNLPCIFYNGALVLDMETDEPLLARTIKTNLRHELQTILDKYPDAGVEILVDGHGYIVRWNDIIREQLAREGMTGEDASWDDIKDGWFKALVLAEKDTLVLARADLTAMGRDDIEILFSEDTLLDMMANGVSKGTALGWIRQKIGTDWHTVFAIGDNENDADLVRFADVGIAVGNACPSVKLAAQYVIQPHNIPCIPQVLQLIDANLEHR